MAFNSDNNVSNPPYSITSLFISVWKFEKLQIITVDFSSIGVKWKYFSNDSMSWADTNAVVEKNIISLIWQLFHLCDMNGNYCRENCCFIPLFFLILQNHSSLLSLSFGSINEFAFVAILLEFYWTSWNVIISHPIPDFDYSFLK